MTESSLSKLTLPTVSVVIPAYNAATLVGDAVASALSQTYPLNEIVCVDDGSSDGTLEVLRALEATHPGRLTILTGPNRGGSAARNRGIAVTTAEYVQFLDADDLLLPAKVERDVELVAEARPPLLFGMHDGFRDGEKIFTSAPYSHRDPWVSFAHSQLGNTVSNLFRRDTVLQVGGWDESRPYNQEYDLIARMLVAEPRVAFGDHRSTHIRLQEGSVGDSFPVGMREARAWIDARVLRHLEEIGHDEASGALKASLFLQLRQLYRLQPRLAVDLHQQILGSMYVPVANASNTALYRVTYRYLGFSGAETVKSIYHWGRESLQRVLKFTRNRAPDTLKH